MAAIAAGLREREAQSRFPGEKRAAGEAAAVARGPAAAPVVLDVEVVAGGYGSRNKVAHLAHAVVEQRRYIKFQRP